MDEIRKYLLSVIAATIISGMITGLLGKKGTYSSVVKLLCGIFVAITVVAPLTKIQFSDYDLNIAKLQSEADKIIETADADRRNETAERIKEQTETYILKKASELNLAITVDVLIDTYDTLLPQSINITGAASPSAKGELQEIIANDLGISKENQTWN